MLFSTSDWVLEDSSVTSLPLPLRARSSENVSAGPGARGVCPAKLLGFLFAWVQQLKHFDSSVFQGEKGFFLQGWLGPGRYRFCFLLCTDYICNLRQTAPACLCPSYLSSKMGKIENCCLQDVENINLFVFVNSVLSQEPYVLWHIKVS